MGKWTKLIIIILLVALTALSFAWFQREMQIDKCLDGGGAWDYSNAKCDKD